jgi:hypothetical protein
MVIYIANICVCMINITVKWRLWNYVISGYLKYELSNANTLNKRKLCSRSRASRKSLVSVYEYHAYSVSIDIIFVAVI